MTCYSWDLSWAFQTPKLMPGALFSLKRGKKGSGWDPDSTASAFASKNPSLQFCEWPAEGTAHPGFTSPQPEAMLNEQMFAADSVRSKCLLGRKSARSTAGLCKQPDNVRLCVCAQLRPRRPQCSGFFFFFWIMGLCGPMCLVMQRE